LALEENPFEIIKRNLAWSKRSFVMKKKTMRKKKATANKPKPKPIKIDDFDEDFDGNISKTN
jgi:hypothetical protein